MLKTPQMESIIQTIQSFKVDLDKQLLELEGADREVLPPENFAALITGLQTLRQLPGVPDHMGFTSLYHCPTEDGAKELSQYLNEVFGIHDPDSLAVQAHEFFHIHNEYMDFIADWNDNPNFDVNELDPESRTIYENSRDFAEFFRDLVGEQGFLAWDIGERAMLIRAACACGVITDDYAVQCLNTEMELAFTYFHNWAEYAVSCACGAVYYMFASTGRTEDDGLSAFLQINLDIIKSLFEHKIWKINAWFYIEEKKLAISMNQIQNLLDDEMMPLSCVCSDRILCDGYRVTVMVRDTPVNPEDSGWRFFAGDETKDFIENGNNFGVVPLNLVCNYSADIIPLLDSAPGTFLARDNKDVFRPHDQIDENGNYVPGNSPAAAEDAAPKIEG